MSTQRAAQLVEAGLFLRLSGDLDGAKRLFEQALRLDPTNARAKQLLEGGGGSSTAPAARPGSPLVPSIAPAAAVNTAPAPRPFSPPAVAPASPAGFDSDWGSVMDGASGDNWGTPRTTAPVAPMGAPQTTTMAFPLNEARAMAASVPQRAPQGAPQTSTMAYPMGPAPAQQPMGAPPTSTIAYPMGPAPPAQQPMGAPQTSTMAYPMEPMASTDGIPPVRKASGWTPPPFARPGAANAAPPGPPAGNDWPAQQAADSWGDQHPEAWNESAPQDPWKDQGQRNNDPWGAQAAQPPQSGWGEPAAPPADAGWETPASQDSGWGAPPTSTLAYPMSPQAEPHNEVPAAPSDPWGEFRVAANAAPPADPDAAIWNSVALAPPQQAPQSYAPPQVDDPYSQPGPVSDSDWEDARPSPATPTAPQGVPTVAARPLPQVQSLSPLPPVEAVPWDSPVPVDPPTRPRPDPVAFADWAQPTEAPASGQSGPWSTGDTPVQPIPAPPPPPPMTLQPLAPMLPGPPPPKPAMAPAPPPLADEIDDIEVDEEIEETFDPPPPSMTPAPVPALVAGPPRAPEAAPVPAHVPVAMRPHAMASGIPDASDWEDPGIEAAVVEDGDTLDSDFSFSPPAQARPPAVASAILAPPPPAPVAVQPAPIPPPPPSGPDIDVDVVAPPPSGPPPLPPGYEASLVKDAQSAWDSNSNPGLKLVTAAPPKEGDAFDLIQKDEHARKAVAPEPDKKDKLASLIRRAKDLIGLDDHTGAMALINQADALAPNDGEVKRLKERSEATLQRMYESKIGNLDRVPRVKLKETEIIWLNLDHRAGFMLAQVDGGSTFEDLFALSGMSRLDTARILAQLIDQGVIVA